MSAGSALRAYRRCLWAASITASCSGRWPTIGIDLWPPNSTRAGTRPAAEASAGRLRLLVLFQDALLGGRIVSVGEHALVV